MVKIVILEDEDQQAKQTLDFLRRYEQESKESFTIERYSQAISLLESYRCDADILLLDIQVPDMLGIDAAKKLREMDESVIIMFITNLAQYAIEGYSVEAMDYILKPLAYASFSAKLARALRVVEQRHAEGVTISIKSKSAFRRISSSQLAYIEVVNHTLVFHLTDGSVLKQWGSLGAFQQLLEGDHFVRCNSGYLVNLKYVESVEGDSVVVKGSFLKISAPKRRDFLRAVSQYKGGSR